MMCMHNNPHCIKVEVEDVEACPSLACKITGEVTTNDLLADTASLKALAEAAAMASAAAAALAKEVSVEVAAKLSATTSAAASEKGEGMLESALKIIEYSVFFYHNLIGSQVEVVGTGEKQRNRTCKLHKQVPCGSQLCVGTFVCFRKNQFAWRNEKDDDCWKFLSSIMVFRGVRLGICPSILLLGRTVTMVSAPVLSRFTPTIAQHVTTLPRGRSSIAVLVVAWR